MALTDDQKASLDALEEKLLAAIDAMHVSNDPSELNVRGVLNAVRAQLETIAVERVQ